MSEGTDAAANHWETVQLTNGKQVPRTNAVEVKAMRWECPEPDHSGGYKEPGECRICSKVMVEVEMMVRWAEKE